MNIAGPGKAVRLFKIISYGASLPTDRRPPKLIMDETDHRKYKRHLGFRMVIVPN